MALRLPLLALALIAFVAPLHAESIEKGFDLSAFESFERKEQERQRDGFVLEKASDKKRRTTSQLSLGGSGREEDPFYDFGATQNIRASRDSEVGQGLINLRISF